ncbi:MAG: hypothetical protein RL632_1616 [Bacteroidota bacterium]
MNVLSIELSEHSIRTVILENNQSKVVQEEFTDRQEHRIKDQLKEFFEKTGLRAAHFDEHLVSWSAQKSTLIPSNVFSESTPDDLYRLCFGKPIEAGAIDYNRIPEHGIVNLFQLPSWVKSFFVLNFPRSIIQHEGTHLLRGILSQNAFRLKASLLVYPGYFLLTLVKENKLLFYSQFDQHSPEDITYHTLFVLQQKELMDEPLRIEICNGVGMDQPICDEVIVNLNKIASLQATEITYSAELIQKSILLCV